MDKKLFEQQLARLENKQNSEQNPCDTCGYEELSIYCKEHCPHEEKNNTQGDNYGYRRTFKTTNK